MPEDREMVMLNKILRAVEMHRREVRMRNKVALYNAILAADAGDLDYVELARDANKVYAELYVLERPRRRDRS